MFIPLTNSEKFAIVDEKHYNRIIALNTDWYLHSNGRQIAGIRSTKKINGQSIYLSRFIMNCPNDNGLDVDHQDHDILNCQEYNLRIITFSQNRWNSKKYSTNTSGHKNINWSKQSKKWRVYVTKYYKQHHIGFFDTIEEAIIARNLALEKLHGEFSYKE